MALKRIIGRKEKKYKTCLNCGKRIEGALKDNEVYTCKSCGQQHLIDVYKDHITITVAERPELRNRPATTVTPEQQKAREALIAKVEARKKNGDDWEERHRDWLEELAGLPEKERELEFSFMGEEMLRRVKAYLEKRKTE